MSLRWHGVLLLGLLTLLPALPAAYVTHALLEQSLDLGARPEIDASLEAGLRSARRELDARRAALERDLAEYVAERPDPHEAPSFGSRDDRLTWSPDAGEPVVAQAGAVAPDPRPAPARGAPPEWLRASRRTADPAGEWVAVRPLDAAWRADATAVAEGLQLVRSMQAERDRIRRGFLLPFVWIYGITLVLALGLALLLARQITAPVGRLVGATAAVAQGRWDVQVPATGPAELKRLGRDFNRMVRTLDAQSRQLVELEKMEGWREMARALAHEVKNPLTPIQLTVEEMRERYRGDDASYRELLDECTRIVVEEVASLREVVGRFREFSRPVELEPRPVDLRELLRDLGALQRDMQVEESFEPGDATAWADADRLRQVFMNLASNAREAAPGGRLGLGVAPEEHAVRVVVEDDGPGIDESERQRVFEPYRSGKRGGLGLGLALVKGIVIAHGGTIEVDRGRWGGARFTVRLPRSVSDAEPGARPHTAHAAHAAHAEGEQE